MPWSRVLSFADPSLCQAAIQGGDAELLSTARGSFHAEITQIGMNRVWMQRFNFELPQIIRSKVNPDRKAIGFLSEEGSPPLQHCGRELAFNDILVASPDVMHQRSERGCRYATMSVPEDDFPNLYRTVIGRDFPEGQRTSIIRPDPALISRLLKLHRAIGRLAHDISDILLMPEVHRALENELVHFMVRCLAEGAGIEPLIGDRRQAAIIARFEEFLEANPDRPVYLTEICAAIGVAERTLRASCEEHLGMGPIRFLTLRRMYLVHRALLRADPSNSTVTRIVTNHGFWELGRFSGSYRALFGESPSQTLRRPAEQTAVHLNRPSSLAKSSGMGSADLTGRVRQKRRHFRKDGERRNCSCPSQQTHHRKHRYAAERFGKR